MAMANGGPDKLEALERRRKVARTRTAGIVFVLGCLLGAGIAHGFVSLTTPPNSGAGSDRVAPAILAVEPAPGTFLATGPVSFAITFDEHLAADPSVILAGPTNLTANEESFDGRTWRGSIEITGDGDGPRELIVAGIADRFGNRQDDLAFPYGVDATPPVSCASVAANATTVPFDIAWDATDGDGSGIQRAELWIRADGEPWTLLATSSEDRGTYRFDPGDRKATFDAYALAVDRAGNREEAPPTPDATVAYNPSPPSASLLPVGGYWLRGPLSLTAIASANVTEIDLRYHFAPDNATWQGPFSGGNDTAPYGWTFPWPLGPGHYRLYAQGRDAGGTRERDQSHAAAELAVAYDSEAPTSRVRSSAVYWHDSPLAVSVDASDDRSGLASVDVWYAFRPNESAAWSAWSLGASRSDVPWNFTFDFPLGDGRYELAARARDRAGNPEPLPTLGEGELAVAFDLNPPAAPILAIPTFIDAANERTNLTWTIPIVADLARFEVHGGPTPTFSPDGSPCTTSTTCLAVIGRTERTAWAPVPATNETVWFRVRAVDDGGLVADSAAVGANLHGAGFDTTNVIASAAPLPLDIAWSERLQYASGCLDCLDAFKLNLVAADLLVVTLAVPATGDFRLVLYRGGTFVQASARVGLGAWESFAYEVAIAGMYQIVVDWGGVLGPGGRNEGWYTLSARVL